MPKLKARAPGRAWKKGFISIGSQNTALTYPVGAYSVPSRLKRTLQTPAKPGGMGQRCPQAKHSTRLRQGLLALSANDVAQARQRLENASRLKPENAMVWAALAQTYLRGKD